ncbi:E3 ubiquitin-protein ligase RNF170-like [Saccostrea echinata]|uniref:E3 ubiquitin-protein ligase RNF170-like n=1 Tax=Saccostrea echinata TaxID=191078 RepID=UPI002A8269B0|nr:E3 ubiquitin-protein ligase RNF170-like [Saccostrea echinata]
MSYLRSTHLIEGVGDEVLYGIGAFLGILAPMVVYIINRNYDNVQNIHPDSEENVRSTREHLQASARVRSNPGEIDCPVCLGNTHYGIETNCGHIFCGTCITTYWQHGTWLGAVRCPVCRQQVTLLLIHFTEEEHLQTSPEKTEILNKIADYNRRFSGEPRPLLDYLRDLPTLLRHALREFFSVGGLICMFRLRIIAIFLAALFYFISPLDIIPEAVFGILGFLDDIFVLLLLAIYISILYRNYVQSRANTNTAS